MYLTTAQTAEMAKLVENSYRDVNVAFAHQVASMAYAADIDPYELIDLANKHPRVNILRPTCGVGGHCLAVDPWFLVESFPQETALLKVAREVNDAKPAEVLKRIATKVARWKEMHQAKTCRVLLLGLTYKPDVDDLREAPALAIARQLIKENQVDVLVCEPNVQVTVLEKQVGKRVVSLQEGVQVADIIVCLVAHTPFKALDKNTLAHKKIIDCCGLLHRPTEQLFSGQQFFAAAYNQEEFRKGTTTQGMWFGKSHTEREEAS
jgi:UDP-N-acetyl-D-mannosaminuronic acid dehydrogenase